MPKLGMEPIRKIEAINATLECIYECGIDRITLDMVAEKAGFSKGIVTYYFKSKKNLVLESLKAFLAAYNHKIGASVKKEKTPLDMVKAVVEVALPPVADQNQETINISTMEGAEKIRLPQKRIAKIFVQFISMASVDDDLKKIMRENYTKDVDGIALLIKNAQRVYAADGLDDKEAAYAILAMIFGLSFFRIDDFMPLGEMDNRTIAFDFIDRLFGAPSDSGKGKGL